MLRGKQENPVDGGNVEEQKRRKLNAVRCVPWRLVRSVWPKF